MSIADAVVAAISDAVPVPVYDGLVLQTPPQRHVVVYVDNGTLSSMAVCGVSDSAVVRWTIHAIAPDRAMAAWLAMRVRDAIVDQTMTATGWVCGPVQHTFSQQPQREEVVMERPISNAIDQYSLLATRVPVEDSSSS